MEADNLLADHLQVCGPVFLEGFLRPLVGRAKSDGRDVIRQRVQPHVDHMLGIVRYRNTPRKSRSADREIAQSATHKRNHFIAPRFRTDELWVGIKFEQLILKSRQLEEIILFLYGLGRPSAVRTGSARLRTIHIELVGHAILSGVSAFVDVTVVTNTAKQFLHALLMPVFCGADEVVVRDTHALPQFTEFRGDLVRILLWSFTSGLCRPLDLLPVFVSAGEKKRVRAQQ